MAYRQKPRWTARQKNFLIENYATMLDEVVADHLGKSVKSVRRMRERMGLKKVCGRGLCAAREDTATRPSVTRYSPKLFGPSDINELK